MRRAKPPEEDLFSLTALGRPASGGTRSSPERPKGAEGQVPATAAPKPAAPKKGAPPQPEVQGPQVYTVSQLVEEVKELLEAAHPAVYVKGEVTDYRGVHSSGHLYFRLKDANAVLEMACFRGNVRKLRFALEEGMEV